MKCLICSDIHGSSYFLKQVLQYFDDSFDHLIILGDVLYHGPRNDLPEGYAPKEVIKLLNPLKDKIICVRGNCDAEVDQMVLDFKINEDYYLKINNKNIYLVHGHHLNFDNLNSYNADVIMYGHYHIPRIEYNQNVLLCNPGSISIPKSEEKNTFMILENQEIKLVNLSLQILKTIHF